MKNLILSALCFLVCTELFAQWPANAGEKKAIGMFPVGTQNTTPLVVPGEDESSIVAFVSAKQIDPEDFTSYKVIICVQKLKKDGSLAWGDSSHALQIDSFISNTYRGSYGLSNLVIKPDGNGGVYVLHARESTRVMVAQHVDASGQKLWTDQGVIIESPSGFSDGISLDMCADGGIVAGWNGPGMMIQRVDKNGILKWDAGGKSIPTLTGELVSDGKNGAIIVFNDMLTDNIYVQRIDDSGHFLWPGGVKACITNSQQTISTGGYSWGNTVNAVADGHGGVIFFFKDTRDISNCDGTQGSAANANIYAQKIDSNGQRKWTDEGVPVTYYKSNGNSYFNIALHDGNGGAVMQWGIRTVCSTSEDIRIQRLNADGDRMWGDSGILLTKGWSDDFYARTYSDSIGNVVCSYTYKLSQGGSSQLGVRKITAAGIDAWGKDGINLYPAIWGYDLVGAAPVLNNDGSVVVYWLGWDSKNPLQIYATKLLSNGSFPPATFITIGDGNWDDPSIWQGGIVPPAGADVVISHAVIVNVDVNCHSLQVKNGGSVKVNAGIMLNIIEQ